MNHNLGRRDLAKRVVDVAQELGFAVEITRKNRLKFTRANTQAVYFSGTPGDRRATLNGIAMLKRAARGAA